ARAAGRAMDGRVARTRGTRLPRDTRTALRGGRGRATADLPHALAHASRVAAAEVLHRNGWGDRARGRLYVRVRLQPRAHAAPRPALRSLSPTRERRMRRRKSCCWTALQTF